jgi:mannose-6-phosphate isomerase-like protein (cupin superfamily)
MKLTFALALLIAPMLIPQSANTGATYKTEAQLMAALKASATNPAMLTSPVSIADGGHSINIVRRTSAAGAVAHEGATELHHIIEGSGTLVTGGTIVRPAAGGRGGATIEKGESRRVTKGDVILVPAGMPHWYSQLEGGSITYLEVRWNGK